MNSWKMRCRCGFLVLAAVLVVFATGCQRGGEPTYVTKGRLTSGGQPLDVQGREVAIGMVQLQIFPVINGEASTNSASDTMVEADGTFELLGREGYGIPAGTYRVAVYQYDPYPQDKLRGKFSDKKSPIEITITGEEESLDIDLANYK